MGNLHVRHDGKAKLQARHSGARPLGREPGIWKQRSVLDSGSAPSKSAVADLDNDIAELG
jgi:hypothetical protein